MLLVQLKSVDVACENATLRTSPSSGKATIKFSFATSNSLPATQGQRSKDREEGSGNALCCMPEVMSQPLPIGQSR